MTAQGLRILGRGLAAGGFAWAVLWGIWLVAQHRAGQLDIAAALLGVILFALLPALAAWIAGAILLVRARRRCRQEHDADLETRLAEAVRTRAIVRIAELANEWHISENDIRAAVQRLVGLDLFRGRVDWERGVLTAQYASLTQSCPHCGGPLEPAGQGLLVCRYCGSRFPQASEDRASSDTSARSGGMNE